MIKILDTKLFKGKSMAASYHHKARQNFEIGPCPHPQTVDDGHLDQPKLKWPSKLWRMLVFGGRVQRRNVWNHMPPGPDPSTRPEPSGSRLEPRLQRVGRVRHGRAKCARHGLGERLRGVAEHRKGNLKTKHAHMAVGQNQWKHFGVPILVGIGMFTGGTGF